MQTVASPQSGFRPEQHLHREGEHKDPEESVVFNTEWLIIPGLATAKREAAGGKSTGLATANCEAAGRKSTGLTTANCEVAGGRAQVWQQQIAKQLDGRAQVWQQQSAK